MGNRSPVIIKKYSNRRLYDTDDSRYLTQDELAEKIRGGVDVRVVDAKTGADLTQGTLTQIIIEGRGAGRLLPTNLLHQLIRMGDEALAEFLGRYVGWALEMYTGAKRRAEALSPYNPFATIPFSATDALARMFVGASNQHDSSMWPTPPMSPPLEHEPPPAPPASGPASNDEVAALRREIEALREVVQGGPAKKKRRKRAD